MIAIRMSPKDVVWCHVPKLIRVVIADLFKSAPPQIIPDGYLTQSEMKEYLQFEKENSHIAGRYLEKVEDDGQ